VFAGFLFWAPCAAKCVWCVENALQSALIQTSAELLSAIYQSCPKFLLVAPCANRALELTRDGGHENDLAAQALIRTIETGMLAEDCEKEAVSSHVKTFLALLNGSHACQVAILEVLEIVDAILPHEEWPIEERHRNQVRENEDATIEHKKLFGLELPESPEVAAE